MVLMVSVTLWSCKTRKAAVLKPKPITEELSNKKAENIQLLRSKDLSFNTLSVKAKARLDISGSKNNVSMNIRMEKGKQIWVSITALAGIEVARALITPDSVKVRNNIQGVYLKQPFSYLHKYADKQITFDWLESILSGNTIADFLNGESTIEEENGIWMLQGEREKLAYKMMFDGLLKITETNINDTHTGKALKVQYSSGYQDMAGVLLPRGLTINSMVGTRTVSIELEYSGIERNVPLDFPFTVPRKYEVIN